MPSAVIEQPTIGAINDAPEIAVTVEMGVPGPNSISDATALGALTDAVADALALLATNAAGTQARRVAITSVVRAILQATTAAQARAAVGLTDPDPSPAGSYTLASVTVDSTGRVTAASSGSGGGGGTWGSITGTLSAQTDLAAALNAKAGLASANTFTANQTVSGGAAVNVAYNSAFTTVGVLPLYVTANFSRKVGFYVTPSGNEGGFWADSQFNFSATNQVVFNFRSSSTTAYIGERSGLPNVAGGTAVGHQVESSGAVVCLSKDTGHVAGGFGPWMHWGVTSTSANRPQAQAVATWVDSTDATRLSRYAIAVYSTTTAQEGMRVEANSGGVRVGFFGGSAAAKPTVSGSRGGNAALASILTALAGLGLLTDSTTA